MRGLREAVLGSPEAMGRSGLLRALRWGDEGLRARAVRGIALRAPEVLPRLLPLLDDPVPAVRRAVAWAVGQPGVPEVLPARRGTARLRERLAVERHPTVAHELAVALVRLGLPPAEALPALRRAAARPLRTFTGWRVPAEAWAGGSLGLERGWVQALDPDHAGPAEAVEPRDPRALREALRARLLEQEPGGIAWRRALEALGWQGHPEDLPFLMEELRLGSGRRVGYSLVHALGHLGDPRALAWLVERLDPIHVDPGRAFALRRSAALALGRIGLPRAGRALVAAVGRERREHEGSPGAGLGVQFPVRAALLRALGEAGAARAAPLLAEHLGEVARGAFGGFHLAAGEALVCLGRPAAPAVERVAVHGRPPAAALNAVGVLEAIGDREALARVARGRGQAATLAAAILEGRAPPPQPE